ncbi:hypothetical protein ACJ2A9_17255 [Anaerobacillus sp. MEB173]|uniref:hypothetical protein n=1 Tax=Anaerobacillus sp. MEB173 TaxID=3383345 RepID=UPI003F8F0E4C
MSKASYSKKPVVTYCEGNYMFQIGKTEWELVVKSYNKRRKRTFFERLIGFDPNEPVKRTSFFDIINEDETDYHCIIGFRDQEFGQFTYTKLNKEQCMIGGGIVIASKHAFKESNRSNDEEKLMMDIIEESSIMNGATITSEDKVNQGELKDKYEMRLTRDRHLVVNGYHYAFVAASYASLLHFDGFEDFAQAEDFGDSSFPNLF